MNIAVEEIEIRAWSIYATANEMAEMAESAVHVQCYDPVVNAALTDALQTIAAAQERLERAKAAYDRRRSDINAKFDRIVVEFSERIRKKAESMAKNRKSDTQ